MPDEYVDIINRFDDSVVYEALKTEAHRLGLWHRGVHIWVTYRRKILLQKRADIKDMFSGLWDVACAGHLKKGETYKQAAIRELKEELGLKINAKELKLIDKREQHSVNTDKKIISNELIEVYSYRLSKQTKQLLAPNKNEISDISFLSSSKLKKDLIENPYIFVPQKKYFNEILDKIFL